jgi:hypothetical protein
VCHHPFPGGKDLRAAAIHHAAEGEDEGVEGEVAGWAVPDLIAGNGVEVLGTGRSKASSVTAAVACPREVRCRTASVLRHAGETVGRQSGYGPGLH